MGVRKLHMRQAYRIIPIYTADVSGVCSALYELGGMTVMHDPSGCNSTYNTHDEIRWYDQDSLIFISGLTDIDAIMGNDEKFLRDIEDVAEELKPKFIALASSPIPFMNGTDFPGLARALTAETGIPAFSVPTSGMHDYVYGAGLALSEIARHFTGAAEKRKRKLNLLCSAGQTEIKSSWSNTPGFWPPADGRCHEKTSGRTRLGDPFHLGYGRYAGRTWACR